MQIKISSGELVEVNEACQVFLSAGVAESEGPFQVLGFDSELPILEVVAGEKSIWDGSLIAKVVKPEQELETIDIGKETITVDKESANIVSALQADNVAKQELIEALKSGDEMKALQEELDALKKNSANNLELAKSLAQQILEIKT